MTGKQNRRNLLIACALSCGSVSVFLTAAFSGAPFAEMPDSVRVFILVMTFFAMCGVVVFLGPLGIFPHIKKMFPKGSSYWKAFWFVPNLED